jgi:hypothetical protein
MSDQNERDERERESKDDDAIRALLKRAADPAKGAPPPDLLRGVQRKIRARSKGKFYGDGWSTTHSRVNYALIALAMLLVIAVAYVALGPMGISAH